MSQNIIAVVDDMFFASKIRAAAEHLGIEVRFPRSVATALESAREDSPALLIVDLHARRCDPFVLAESLKADAQLSRVPILGFFSHVQTALQRRAEASGFDRVMPRSAFTRHLHEILRGAAPAEP